jgi:p24 family protein delta-1
LSTLLLLAVFLLSAPPPARALRFDLESGHTKCISDEIKVGSMAVGKYHVVGPDPNFPDAQLPESHRISLRVSEPRRVIWAAEAVPMCAFVLIGCVLLGLVAAQVTSPYGNSMHYAENVQSGHFAFTAAEAGDYLACFWAPDHKPAVAIGFEFDWRSGVSTKDWPSVAKKGKVDVSISLLSEFLSFFFAQFATNRVVLTLFPRNIAVISVHYSLC